MIDSELEPDQQRKEFAGLPFQRHQARALLKNKYVLILGDSVSRSAYRGKSSALIVFFCGIFFLILETARYHVHYRF